MTTANDYKRLELKLAELSSITERVVEKVATMDSKVDKVSTKLDNLQDTKVNNTITDIAVLKEKVYRLQSIVYGSMSVIGVQGLVIIGGIILWLVKR